MPSRRKVFSGRREIFGRGHPGKIGPRKEEVFYRRFRRQSHLLRVLTEASDVIR